MKTAKQIKNELKEKGLYNQKDVLLWNMVFNSPMNYYFVFDFQGNILASGYIAAQNGMLEEKSLILYPFLGRHDEYTIDSEESLKDFLEEKKLESRTYLDIEKGIKIIYYSHD